MTHSNFTYKELFTFGWDKTKLHFWFLLGVAFIYLVLTVATARVDILGFVVALLFKIALIYLTLVIVDNHVPKFADMLAPFRTYKILLHFFVASLLYALTIAVGLLLFILPGIYVLVRLQFFSFLLVEHENMSVMHSFRKSMEMTKGKFWKLFGFLIVLIGVNIIGALLLGVGLLFTIPMSAIAYTLLYRKLSSQTPSHEHHEHEHHHGAAE